MSEQYDGTEGTDAAAAGMDVMDGGENWNQGWQSINKTRDMIAQQIGGISNATIHNADSSASVTAGSDSTGPRVYSSGIRSRTYQTAGPGTSDAQNLVVITQQGTLGVLNDPIDTNLIADAAITHGKVAPNAITRGNIVDGEVTSTEIAAGAVTSSKIANGTILYANLADPIPDRLQGQFGAVDIHTTGDIYIPDRHAVSSSYVAAWINGDGRIGYTPSARRYKRDIHPYDGSVLGLTPVTYVLKDDDNAETRIGIIADDADPHEPLLTIRQDGQPESFRYELLAVALLRDVQRQQATIADLQARLAKIEAALPGK